MTYQPFTAEDRKKAYRQQSLKTLSVLIFPYVGLAFIVLSLGYVGNIERQDSIIMAGGTGKIELAETVRPICDYSATVNNGPWEEVCGDLQDITGVSY